MSRNQITKSEIKAFVLEKKNQLNSDSISYSSDPRTLANKYLNMILERLEEYRY